MGRFHRRHYHHNHSPSVFKRYIWFARHHPIISSGMSAISGIILLRLAFTNFFQGEVRFWVVFIGFVLLLIALVSFIIWTRRNVPTLFTKHDVNWRNR